MKKIFIAGHNGFLGQSILNEFIKDKKYKIITISKKKLDLTNITLLENFFAKNEIDLVINAAGLVGGIKKNIENQIDFLDKNYLIQSNLIKIAYKNKIKKFINLSSSCVYPVNAKQPLKETYLLNGKLEKTNEGYALAKLCGIKLAEFYKNKYNFDITTLIPCNLFGTNDKFFDDNSHFISGIISKIYNAQEKKKKFVKLWGSGKPKREIMLNTELSRVIKFVLENKINEININVGTGVDYTIKQYANKIKKIMNYEGEIIWDTSMPDGIKRKLLDITLLKKYKFQFKHNTEDGLKLVVKQFLDDLNSK